MSQSAQEKKANTVYADHFTRVPNILFESYKYITKEEVLLYIRLRYVYWDTKPRYLSLRELADATGYSTGALSKMLPRLNTVGLVHAEVKKKKGHDGKEKGNPVYHISINDIWEENRKFFADGKFDPSEVLLVHQMNATCSPNEQDTAKPVHQMNKPVHKTNKVVQEMNDPVPFGEQDQAQNDPYKTSYKTSNKTSLQEERAVTDARALEHEHENYSYQGHDTTLKHKIWQCEAWCNAHHGTCAEYQQYIDSKAREETPTEPRVEAVKIGVSNDSPAHSALPAPGDASGSAGIPGDLRPGGRSGRDGVSLEEPQQPALRAAGAPQPQVAIASTPGRAVAPPAATVPHSLQGPIDGAATALEGSESRASHGKVTQESILDDWDAVQGRQEARDARLIKAARDGVRASPTREELAGCRDWLPTTDRPGKPWYRLHGVALWDVIEKLGAYRSYLAMSIEPAPLADVKKTPTEAPVKRWNAAEHRKMLKEFEARERRELDAKQQNLQA